MSAIDASTLIEDLQDAVYLRIKADPFFANVTVLRERRSTTIADDGTDKEVVSAVEQLILRALGTVNQASGTVGACVVVFEPQLDKGSGNLNRPNYRAEIEAQVFVNPLLNNSATGTHKSDGQLAMRIDRLLLGKRLPGTASMLVHDGDAITPLRKTDVPPGARGKAVVFHCDCGIATAAGDECALPTASYAAGNVTLACVTSGATIHFTTDGSCPSSANPDATTYTVPFAASSGDVIFAVAEHAEKFASDLLRFVIP